MPFNVFVTGRAAAWFGTGARRLIGEEWICRIRCETFGIRAKLGRALALVASCSRSVVDSDLMALIAAAS